MLSIPCYFPKRNTCRSHVGEEEKDIVPHFNDVD